MMKDDALEEFGDEFVAIMGASDTSLLGRSILRKIVSIRSCEIPNTKSETKIKKYSKRLKLLEAFFGSGNKPNG